MASQDPLCPSSFTPLGDDGIELLLPQIMSQPTPARVPAWARQRTPWFTPGNAFSVIFFILGLFDSVCQFYETDNGLCTQRSSLSTTISGFIGASLIALIDRNTDGGNVSNRTYSARWKQLASFSWFTSGNTLFVIAAALGCSGLVCQFYTGKTGARGAPRWVRSSQASSAPPGSRSSTARLMTEIRRIARGARGGDSVQPSCVRASSYVAAGSLCSDV